MKQLLDHIKSLTQNPENATALKGLILQLAIQGKLTAKWRASLHQRHPELVSGSAEKPIKLDTGEIYENASALLKRIKAEKTELVKAGRLRKEKPLAHVSDAEKPFELPEGWEWCRLGYFTYNFGQKKPTDEFEYIDVTSIDNVTGRIKDDLKTLMPKMAPSRARKIIKRGCVLYSTVRPYLLNIALVDREFKCETIASTAFSVLMPLQQCRGEYLYLTLRSPMFTSYVESKMKGLAYPAINDKNMLSGIVPLPPLPEQKAIVTIVNQLFAEVDRLVKLTTDRQQIKTDFVASALRKLNEGNSQKAWAFLKPHIPAFFNTECSIKQLRESILTLAVQGKLSTKWRKSHPEIVLGDHHAARLLEKIKAEKAALIKAGKLKKEKPLPTIGKDEIPYKLPEGWVWCRIKDTSYSIIPNRDKPKSFTGHITWLTTRNLQRQSNRIHSKTGDKKLSNDELIQYKARLLPSGSVVMSCVGQFGLSAVLDREYSANQQLHCFVPLGMMSSIYIDILIKNSQKTYEDLARATTIAYLNKSKCEGLIIPLPPLAEQKAIVSQVNTLMTLCDQLETQVKKQVSTEKDWMQSSIKAALSVAPNQMKNQSIKVAEEQEEKHFLKRKLVAAYIINQSLEDPHFGNTKFEKLLHLADYHVLKRQLGQQYYQQTAGPYDHKFTYSFFTQVEKAKWFKREQLGNLKRILPAEQHAKSTKTYNYFSEGELAGINILVEQFKSWTYKEAEIVSTLYAVWNNRLIRQQPITDALLKEDFLTWDAQKAQYKGRIEGALSWMRKNNLIPDGWGKVIDRKVKKKT